MGARIITIVSIILMVSLVPVNGANEIPDSLFTVANNNYSGEQFDKAIVNYESIVDLGYESVELYYNLGNAYFKQRNYPKAILNYERSLLINPLDPDVQHNLDKAQVYTVDKIEIIPKFIIKRVYINLLGLLSSNSWALISLVTFLATIGLLFVYFISDGINLRRISFIASFVLLFISVSCFTLSYKSKQNQFNSGGAIIMSSTVTVKGSPSANSTDLFIIHEGTKVYMLDKLDAWFEIRLSDGKQGWVMASDLEII